MDQRNYGALCITGTRAACAEVAIAVERAISLGRQSGFMLPETTKEDVLHIGSGLKRCYREPVVALCKDEAEIPKLEINHDKGTVRFLVSKASAKEFIAVLDLIAEGIGDDAFIADMAEKKVDVWYWPCFGHLFKTGEPRMRFPG